MGNSKKADFLFIWHFLLIFFIASGGDIDLEGPTLNKDVTKLGVLLMYSDLLITQHMVCFHYRAYFCFMFRHQFI